ncbi:MAG: hypothetical protein WD733_02815 [Bryobacterales bacterium]
MALKKASHAAHRSNEIIGEIPVRRFADQDKRPDLGLHEEVGL